MRKQFVSIILSLSLCLTITMTAQASQNSGQKGGEGAALDGDASVVVSNNSIGFAEPSNDEKYVVEVSEYNKPLNRLGAYPFEIKYDTFNNMPVILKSFKVPKDFDPEGLVERDFEENGYVYSRKEIVKSEAAPNVEEKQVSQSVSFTTESDEDATLHSYLDQFLDYAEEGFYGQLELDVSSIYSVAAETKTYSYPIRKVVEVGNLNNNDYIYLNKSDGNLVLQRANWVPGGGTQRGDIILPSAYTAEAVYTGIGYGSKVISYDNTAIYKGTVKKTTDGDMLYTIIYQGVKIKPESNIPWIGMLIGTVILAAIGCAAFFLITKILPNISFRKKKNPPSIDIPN